MDILLIAIWLICGIVASQVASEKGRSGCLFFVLSMAFGPLALLGAAIMSADAAVTQRRAIDSGELRRCPHCAEPIRREAKICPHCRSNVAAALTSQSAFESMEPVARGKLNAGADNDDTTKQRERTFRRAAIVLVLIVVAAEAAWSTMNRAPAAEDAANAASACSKRIFAAMSSGVIVGVPSSGDIRVTESEWRELSNAEQLELAKAVACDQGKRADISKEAVTVHDANSGKLLSSGHPGGVDFGPMQ